MKNTGRRLLSVFMSVLLTLSLVPAQGIAETAIKAAEEETQADGVAPSASWPIEEVNATPDVKQEAGAQVIGSDDADVAELGEIEGQKNAIDEATPDENGLLKAQAEDTLAVSGVYDNDERCIVWTITIQVPKEGFTNAKLINTYASATIAGEKHVEKIESNYDVLYYDKLVSSELDEYDDRFELTFFRDDGYGNSGISGDTDGARTVEITVYTPLDQAWYDASASDSSLANHTCSVTFTGSGTTYEADGTVTMQKPTCNHLDKRSYERVDVELHHWTCNESQCGLEADEQHTYVEDSSGTCTCSKCGQSAVRVTFQPGEGATGEMATVYREIGSTYELPLHKFSAPVGQWFNCWRVQMGTSVPRNLSAQETLTLTSNVTLTAEWNTSMPYVDEYGSVHYTNKYTKVRDTDTTLEGSESGDGAWYVVDGTVQTTEYVTVTGHVNLMLADGALFDCAGIDVETGATLNVYGQREGTGRLVKAGGTAINNHGVVAMYGGTINGSDRGILSEGTSVVLYGGTISGNAHGVDVESGNVTIGHQPQITGNGMDGEDHNLSLPANTVLVVDKPLASGARVGVRTQTTGDVTFTSGYGNYNKGVDPTTIFTSDDPNAVIASELTDNEVALSKTVPYLDKDGNLQYYNGNWRAIESNTTMLTNGWWVVLKDTKVSSRLEVSGVATIVLCDGCTLTCNKGIKLTGSNKLSIYAQQGETGKLIAKTSDKHNAGIGGNNDQSCGTLQIYGGVIEASGGELGAGIGGGDGASGGTIDIHRGNVTATSGSEAAGIGGGNNHGGSGTIHIYGGTVTAKATGKFGAGIGGGDEGGFETIYIYGGTVTARGARYGAGIGTGDEAGGQSGTIQINGGEVWAYGGDEAAGIGGGNQSGGGNVGIHGRNTQVYAKGADSDNYQYASGIGGGDDGAGCTVRIGDGAYVEAHAASKNKPGQAIGHGDGNSISGEIYFIDYPDSAVKSGDTIATKSERTSYMRKKDAIVYPCDHEDGTVKPTDDAKHHKVVCSHCDCESQGEMDHRYDADGRCICGRHEYHITLDPGIGSGDPVTVNVYEGAVQTGSDYTTPTQEEIKYQPPKTGVALRGWSIEGTLYGTGERIPVKKHLTLTAVWNTQWQSVQDAINAAANGANGGIATLTEDVTALPLEEPITIPEGKTVTLDLAGHTLDRGLEYDRAREDGNAIRNYGVLTIMGGGIIRGGNTTSSGGGILNFNSLTLNGVTVSENKARSGGGIYSGDLEEVQGGMHLDDVTVSKNTASLDGGGISYCVGEDENITFSKLNLSENTATERGGGIYLFSKVARSTLRTVTLKDCNISSNCVGRCGGGVYSAVDHTEIKGTTVSNNTAIDCGGGIYLSNTYGDKPMRVSDATVTQNYAPEGSGGGIYSRGELALIGTEISDNSAEENAGVCVMNKIMMTGTTVTNNSATRYRKGAVYSYEGELYLCGAGSSLLPTESKGPVIIHDNTAFGKADNLLISNDQANYMTPAIRVDGSLAEGTEIGIGFEGYVQTVLNNDQNIPITNGLKGRGSASMFTCDVGSYYIGPDRNGEAMLGKLATVTLMAGDGSGTMEPLRTVRRGVCKLPASTFTEPTGRTFKGWQAGDATEPVEAGTVIDVAGDMTVTAVYDTAWTTLQWRINMAEDGAVIEMKTDVKAVSDESALTIAHDKNVTIDLAGHTIDRGLAGASARDGGSAIVNNGTLALTGGGVVKGGNTTGDGGGIYNAGTLTLGNVTVSGNAATGKGGGIMQSGTVNVSGAPVVYDNGASSGGNLYLPKGHDRITVTGVLGAGAKIGVTLENKPTATSPVTVTSGLSGNGKATVFVSDDPAYVFGYDPYDEALLGTVVTVTFDANGASGKMLNVKLPAGGMWVLPDCGFTGVFPSKFAGWMIDGESVVHKPGEKIQITSDFVLILRAYWKNADLFAFPSFKTGSLILSGKIGVNFFVDLTMLDDAERNACYMTFLVNGREQKDTFDINHTDFETKMYHGFTCYVNSIQMAEPIQATLHYGEGQTVSISYNVERYIKILADERNGFDEKTVALAMALADYGHYVQPYLADANNWSVGNDYAEMKYYFTNSYDYTSAAKELASHAFVSDYEGTKVRSASARMFLDSGTGLEVLLKAKDGETLSVNDVSVTVGATGKEAIVSESDDGRISVRLDDVAAYELATPILISYGGKQIISFSALSYANIVVSDTTDAYTQVEKNAMSSLFYYYKACKSYMG